MHVMSESVHSRTEPCQLRRSIETRSIRDMRWANLSSGLYHVCRIDPKKPGGGIALLIGPAHALTVHRQGPLLSLRNGTSSQNLAPTGMRPFLTRPICGSVRHDRELMSNSDQMSSNRSKPITLDQLRENIEFAAQELLEVPADEPASAWLV